MARANVNRRRFIISPSQAATLVVMARHLFPHDALGDQYYASAVALLDEQAAEDPQLAAQLVQGVAELDQAMGIPFIKLSSGNQLKVIENLEGTPFFDAVRAATLGALYTNDTVARAFGFEGSSVEYGGYIDRGFDDLGWLPELPDNA
jgi:cyanophycinase-like exopeptidase